MVLIKLKLLSGEAKSGPYLAPILGQHQINLMEFCKIFNLESLKNYQQNVLLSVKVIKIQGLPLKIDIKGPTSYSLFFNFLSLSTDNSISISRLYDFYKVLLVTKKLGHLTSNKNLNLKKLTAYSMFGFLTSLKKFKVIF